MKDCVEITFLPRQRTLEVAKGAMLLEAAREAFIDTGASCNGKGTCGKCKVQHIEGDISAPNQDEFVHLSGEEIASGVRLACRTAVNGDATFAVLGSEKRAHRILCEGVMPEFEIDPNIRKIFVELPEPSLEDAIDDLGRLERVFGSSLSDISLPLLLKLPSVLRDCEYKITLVFSGSRLIGLEQGDTTSICYGVAVDIGTTTVVAALVDLLSGEEVATASMINPQKDYGLDVLTRIHYLREHPEGLQMLSGIIRDGINDLIKDLSRQTGINNKSIYEIAVAANTAMMHLFLGVNAESLGHSPYSPVFVSAQEVSAHELGLDIADFGSVYCLPSVSGYIGADIVAGIITTEMFKSDEKALFIDIGTNGEIVLGSNKGLSACSCAAGPAFEGMNIRCGMRAADGAIERVYIDGEVGIETIGSKPAAGICGSGIIDAVAELLKAGAVMNSGRFVKLSDKRVSSKTWASRLKDGGSRSFILWSGCNGLNQEIEVTQKDIRQVQLAKGAILSGIVALANRLNVDLSEIDRVYIAGAFGHHIRMDSLARLGVIPPECESKVTLAGNSSKTGAILCLLSREKRREASHIAKQVAHIELSCYPEFDRLFADCLSFPEKK